MLAALFCPAIQFGAPLALGLVGLPIASVVLGIAGVTLGVVGIAATVYYGEK